MAAIAQLLGLAGAVRVHRERKQNARLCVSER